MVGTWKSKFSREIKDTKVQFTGVARKGREFGLTTIAIPHRPYPIAARLSSSSNCWFLFTAIITLLVPIPAQRR
ncbi:hypothetical protein MRB53_030731 [Persea americana]|uniref:Uncharacterized protein n=1 Tax=Persea americana TaxID=3435 RepID=A0ACC2KN39_PERAE|nr:hypothetical protein MRB53_030731 [Persea americana]